MTQSPAWTQRLTAAIGQNIKGARAGRFSAQALANLCTEMGHPIQRDVISNLENGRRGSIPVTDILVIAEVLGVPALSLIFNPEFAGDLVESTPSKKLRVWEAAEEFAGLRPEKHIGKPGFDTWHVMYSLRTLSDYEAAALEHAADADAIRETSMQEAVRLKPTLATETIRQQLRNKRKLPAEQDDGDRELIEGLERKVFTALSVVYRERKDLEAMGVRLWPLPKSLASRYSRVEMEAEEDYRK